LDIGEAEAIVLAIELGTMLLIDEIDGRTAAAAAGVPFVGVLGVLARAKRDGLIGRFVRWWMR
jgi:predicted nucleic acid-binding protein